MTDQSFTTSITMDIGPEQVYDAIKQPQIWWSSGIEGSAEQIGDEFVFDSPGHHCWRFRVVELDPPSSVVWSVLDTSSTDFVADATEWNGTEVRFSIVRHGTKTQVRFTHAGLLPEFECFDACSAGWTGYIQRSLRNFLTTGRAEPGAY